MIGVRRKPIICLDFVKDLVSNLLLSLIGLKKSLMLKKRVWGSVVSKEKYKMKEMKEREMLRLKTRKMLNLRKL